MLLLAPEFVAALSVQWGNTIEPMLIVWVLGALITWRVKRFHITLTYVVSFLFFALLRSFITGHAFQAEVAPITGPMYQLFIFFMITDPKTTVSHKWAQCLVAFLVAAMEMILRLAENIHAPYYALTIVGPLALTTEIWWASRKTSSTWPKMSGQLMRAKSILLPLLVVAALIALWTVVWASGAFHESAFPSPQSVVRGFVEELKSGRLINDLITSLFRVSVGFGLAVLLGLPLGLWMGQKVAARLAFLPIINFFRNLSPLAWMPFAILWFGVGDSPAMFLIFLSVFFPVVLATMAAVANIPKVYFRVAQNFGIDGLERLTQVTLPAILPQIITTLRVTAGLSWLVVVAAEMIAGRDGLGFAVMDSRNGLRTDLLVVQMIVIGLIGVVLDRLLVQLTRIQSVRWGYER